MAIYSLNLRSVGRSTHRPGTAGAHADYVTREAACRVAVAENMPAPEIGARRGAVRAWLDAQEQADRKNARVLDKVTLALPRELDAQQRVDLVRAFVRDITGGVAVPYLAAFHDLAPDADNPHCHLLLRDRGVETGGKRVIGMSERGAVDRLRLAWEEAANRALEAAGRPERIDRRSLLAQGIARDPTQHEGPAAQKIAAKGQRSTKLKRIAHETKPRRKSMEAARRDRAAREAREAKAAEREARRAAKEAERAAKAQREADIAAERQRAALEAQAAREAARVAEREERAQRAAQEAAERKRAEEARALEAPITASRARVLRGRILANNAVGFFRNLREGLGMFDAPTQDHLALVTRALLSAAANLREAWNDLHQGWDATDLTGDEKRFVEASADLNELHMVLAPIKRLDGAEMAAELDRLRDLEAFPDQELIRPAMGQAKGRRARIEGYARTPEGAGKMAEYRADLARQEQQAEREDRERRAAVARRRAEDEADWRAVRLAERRPILHRAITDPDVAAILDRWGVDRHKLTTDAALDPVWDRDTGNGRPVATRIRMELRDLDRDRDARKAQAEADHRARRLQAERNRAAARRSSQPDPEPRPRTPNPRSGPSGPSM